MSNNVIKNIVTTSVIGIIFFFVGFGTGSYSGNTTIINMPPATEIPLPDGRIAKIAEGHDIDYTITTSPLQTYNYHEDNQKGVGSGIKSRNVDSVPEIDAGEAPSITGGSIFAGEGVSVKIVQVIKNGINILYIIGGLCIVAAGVVAWISKSWTPLIYIGGAGVLLIAAAVLMNQYPWIVLVAAGGALILVGWWFWRTYVNKQTETALKGVVAGISTAEIKDPEATQTVLDEINEMNSNLNGTIKKAVDKIKAKFSIIK